MAGQRPDLVLKLVGTPATPVTNPTTSVLNTEALDLNINPDAPKKSVMAGCTSAEIMTSWRAHAIKQS